MITTKVAEIFLDENKVIHLSFPQEKVVVELADSHEIIEARVSLQPGQKQLIMADLTTDPKPSREARDYAKSDRMNETTKGLALIIDSALSRILGNLFLGFNKGDYPVQLFNNKSQAIEWLQSL